jgi:hypothetical protein
MTMDFIPEFDDSLSVDEKVKLLDQATDRLFSEKDRVLSAHDNTLLHKYAADDSPIIRNAAIETLTGCNKVTGEDVQLWLLDPDEDVRGTASMLIVNYGYTPMDNEGKQWLVEIISKSASTYNQMPVETYWLVEHDPEILNLFWDELGKLLDLENKDLTGTLTCGLLEHILGRGLIEYNDPRLQSWITGSSKKRKKALLAVVDWLSSETRLKTIAEALAEDSDPEIAAEASQILEKRK